MSMLVRLYPYNPKTGHTYKTFTYAGIQFRAEGSDLGVGMGPVAGQRWYSVSDQVAKYLKTAHVDNDPNAPLAFHVATFEEAEAFEKEAGRTLDPRTTAEFERLGGDMRSADLGMTPTGARVVTGRGLPPNPEDRPGGASSLERSPPATHATDPNPAAPGQATPSGASTLGTPSNPIDAGGKAPEASAAPARRSR